MTLRSTMLAGIDDSTAGVGVIEIIAGLGLAIKPRLFAPVVMVWLCGIIANLMVLGN